VSETELAWGGWDGRPEGQSLDIGGPRRRMRRTRSSHPSRRFRSPPASVVGLPGPAPGPDGRLPQLETVPVDSEPSRLNRSKLATTDSEPKSPKSLETYSKLSYLLLSLQPSLCVLFVGQVHSLGHFLELMDDQAGHVAVNSRWGGLFSGVLWERWASESNNLAHRAPDQPCTTRLPGEHGAPHSMTLSDLFQQEGPSLPVAKPPFERRLSFTG
jgi:hypothetical protein